VYFGGKLVVSHDPVVAVDRSGSVRANGDGQKFAYYPYGEEKAVGTAIPDGREKFGTYVRDSATQDYADQRYYGVGTGRFNVPDPYQASAGPGEPGSWNRYTYVQADPVNFHDSSGLLQAASDGTDGGDCVHLYVDGISYGCIGGGGGGSGAGGGGGSGAGGGGGGFACIGMWAAGLVPTPDAGCYAPGGDDGDDGSRLHHARSNSHRQ
jgi:RHS repeat-associated protein